MTAIKIVVFVLIANIEHIYSHHHHKSQHRYHLINLLKSRNTFFKQFNQATENAVNGLFETLHVSKHFSKEPKIKTLLTMHQDLIDIAEKNFDIYDVLKNASDVDVGVKPINQVRLNDFMIRVLNETDPNEADDTDIDHLVNIESTTRSESFSSEFANSHEFRTFIGGFIGTLNRLTIDDLFEKKNNENIFDSELSGRRDFQEFAPSSNETEIYSKESISKYEGKTASISSYPFVVSVHIKEKFSCTGSIISADHVLTAASCLKIPEKTHVRHSSDYTSQLGELIPAQTVYLHPKFDANTLRNNVAVLHLEKHLSTKSIAIDRSNTIVPYNTEITILGWSTKHLNETITPLGKLSSVILTAKPIDECKEKYSSIYVNENNFCARLRSNESSFCGGDGGPGIINNHLLYGIISFGAPKCGHANDPTVFTKVGIYMEWIDYIMKLPSKQDIETNLDSTDSAPVYYNKSLQADY